MIGSRGQRVVIVSVLAIILVFFFVNVRLFQKALKDDEVTDGKENCSDEVVALLKKISEEERKTAEITKESEKVKKQLESFKQERDACVAKNGGDIPTVYPDVQYPIGVVIITYNRPNYLERCLESVFKYLPRDDFVVIVSQDLDTASTTQKVQEWQKKLKKEDYNLLHIQHADRYDPKPFFKLPGESTSYYYISQHFKFAFQYAFETLQLQSVIVIEEDLDIAPDFFDYFKALQPLLLKDETLFCVSAWNDNGRPGLVSDKNAVRRSNFFPGLGWMITRKLWKEFGPKWPHGYWDDWLREPEQRAGRDCIHPEVGRSHTFGESGSSGGQFYSQYLKNMILNDEKIDWSKFDPSSLLRPRWREHMRELVASATEINSLDKITNYSNKTLIIFYDGTEKGFLPFVTALSLMPDFKAGVPRTAYEGVVMVRRNDNLVLIAPKNVNSRLAA